MSRLEAPSEPSMDEILAQIRKIIADEPLQARVEHAQIAAQRRPLVPPRPQHKPAPAPETDAIARLETVLNSSPRIQAEDDLSDLVEPATIPATSHVAATDVAILPEAVEELSAAVEDTPPLDTPPAAIELPPVAAETAQGVGDTETAPDLAAREEPSSVSVVVEEKPSEPPTAMPIADAMETALDTLAAGLAAASTKTPIESKLEQSASAASATTEPAPIEASAADEPADDPAPALPEAVDASVVEPELVTSIIADTPPASIPEIDVTAPLEAPLAEPEDVPAAADAALATLPQPELAMPVSEVTGSPFSVATPTSAAVQAQQSSPAVHSVQADPAVVAPVAAAVTAAVNAAPSVDQEQEPASSLDDTMADLLRPMLRQWLDENMPRIVERALRVEMAQMRKPKK